MRLRINYMLFQTLRSKSGDGDCNGSDLGKFEYFCEASFDFGNVTKCPTYKNTPFNNRIRILYMVQYIMEIFTVIDINISFLGPFISLFFNWKDFLFLVRITRPRWSWVQSCGNFSISWSNDVLIKPLFCLFLVGFLFVVAFVCYPLNLEQPTVLVSHFCGIITELAHYSLRIRISTPIRQTLKLTRHLRWSNCNHRIKLGETSKY